VQELDEKLEGDRVAAVHAARKAVKKERALLRLVRGALPAKQRARENAALREAARGLSGVRDGHVMVQTIDGLSERFAGQLPERTFTVVREQLVRERDAGRAGLAGSPASTHAVEDLRAVLGRIEEWKVKRDGWRAIDAGLLRTYQRGRRAFRRARNEPSIENLHAWRKRVKDLWYQLRLLAPVCGPGVRGHANEAHRLADLLGDDHDLGVLREALERIGSAVAVDLGALEGLIDYRRDELQAEAMSVGHRLYAETPKAFGRRLYRCWNAGRGLARALQQRQPAELAEVTRSVGAA
jgi:CHAD domain-containing protein